MTKGDLVMAPVLLVLSSDAWGAIPVLMFFFPGEGIVWTSTPTQSGLSLREHRKIFLFLLYIPLLCFASQPKQELRSPVREGVLGGPLLLGPGAGVPFLRLG